jgi:predicted acetyltransferase
VKVEVVPAAAGNVETIANLMSLYLHEFSDIDVLASGEVAEDGRYRSHYLDLYWTQEGRYPFLIRVDGRLAGFALVARRAVLEPRASGHAITEFFVLRSWRRRGVGRRAARTLFDRFRGAWSVAEHPANTAAQTFWRNVLAEYTLGAYQEELRGEGHAEAVVQTFDSARL